MHFAWCVQLRLERTIEACMEAARVPTAMAAFSSTMRLHLGHQHHKRSVERNKL